MLEGTTLIREMFGIMSLHLEIPDKSCCKSVYEAG